MKVIFCRVFHQQSPERNPREKWYIPKYAWPDSYSPDYCNGPSYLLTSTAIKFILQQTPNFYLISVEDILFTGILAEAAGIKRIKKRRIIGVCGITNPYFYGCDENGMPYLTAVYHINPPNGLLVSDDEDKENPILAATKKLSKFDNCPNKFLSIFYWFWH